MSDVVRKSIRCPIPYGDGKTMWRDVGSAFIREDKINIVLDVLPINGKLVVFLKDREGKAPEGRHLEAELPF